MYREILALPTLLLWKDVKATMIQCKASDKMRRRDTPHCTIANGTGDWRTLTDIDDTIYVEPPREFGVILRPSGCMTIARELQHLTMGGKLFLKKIIYGLYIGTSPSMRF